MNKIVHSSKITIWETPQDLFDKLNEQYGFTTDVCALPKNKKCDHFYSPQKDGLKQNWRGVCWMNPPYGRDIAKWIEKAYVESRKGCTVVALLPVRTCTRWFHTYIYRQDGVTVEFLKGRLKFGGSTEQAPFPNMVVVFKGQV